MKRCLLAPKSVFYRRLVPRNAHALDTFLPTREPKAREEKEQHLGGSSRTVASVDRDWDCLEELVVRVEVLLPLSLAQKVELVGSVDYSRMPAPHAVSLLSFDGNGIRVLVLSAITMFSGLKSERCSSIRAGCGARSGLKRATSFQF